MQINEVRRIQYFLDISLILVHCLYVKQEACYLIQPLWYFQDHLRQPIVGIK